MYAVHATHEHQNYSVPVSECQEVSRNIEQNSDPQHIDKHRTESKTIIDACPKSSFPVHHHNHHHHNHPHPQPEEHSPEQPLQQQPRKARVHFASTVRVHPLTSRAADTNEMQTTHQLSTHQPKTTHEHTRHPAATSPRTTELFPLQLNRHPLPLGSSLPFVTVQYKLQNAANVRLPPLRLTTQHSGGKGVKRASRSRIDVKGNLRLVYVNDV